MAEGCPYAFYLRRTERVWQRPAAWSPQGTAEHEAYELWELGSRVNTLEEVQGFFLEAYTREINLLLDDTPNTAFWFWSGRYDGETDIVRRREIGLANVERTLQYYQEHPEERPERDAGCKPMLELEFLSQLGTVEVKCVIDWMGVNAIYPVHPPGEVHDEAYPRDYKSGSSPGKPGQL